MTPSLSRTLALGLALLPAPLAAQGTGPAEQTAPYAGLETRAIKSLSQADIEELRRGGGWRLALPAELNGVPGPAHLLELKDQIGLSPEQVAAIEAIQTEMKVEAIVIGEKLIAAEQAIEVAFSAGGLQDDRLRALIGEAAAARADLRFVHLSRHLQTPDLLSAAQITMYNELRGYSSADPCARVPEGRDPAMWRKHNGCE